MRGHVNLRKHHAIDVLAAVVLGAVESKSFRGCSPQATFAQMLWAFLTQKDEGKLL